MCLTYSVEDRICHSGEGRGTMVWSMAAGACGCAVSLLGGSEGRVSSCWKLAQMIPVDIHGFTAAHILFSSFSATPLGCMDVQPEANATLRSAVSSPHSPWFCKHTPCNQNPSCLWPPLFPPSPLLLVSLHVGIFCFLQRSVTVVRCGKP